VRHFALTGGYLSRSGGNLPYRDWVANLQHRTLLERLIRQSQRTVDETCTAFEQCARERGEQATLSPRQLARWMSGGVGRPRPVAQRVAEVFWGYGFDALLGSADMSDSGRGGSVTVAPNDRRADAAEAVRETELRELGTTSFEQPVDALRLEWGAATMTGHGPNGVIPSPWTIGRGVEIHYARGNESSTDDSEAAGLEQRVAAAARRAILFVTSRDSSNTGRTVLEHLRAEAARLATAYEQRPLSEVVGDIVALQDQTFLLLEGQQRPSETRELYVLAAIASGLLAKCANDLADPHMAMTHARTAIICSENAEFPSLTAWVRGIQCLISYWAGSSRETIRYAQLGANTPGVTGSVVVWLRSIEARAWAAAGNASESDRMINLANDARDSLTLSELDQLGGFCYFPRGRQMYYAAGAKALIAESCAQAEVYGNDALQEFAIAPASERAWSDVLGTHTELAIAHVQRSDFEGASEAIRPVLELPVAQRIHGMIVSVRKVHQAITTVAAQTAVARDLQDEIEAYCRTPAAALPR
jgi:hypothetical protein